jgi:hypothetical protein
MRIEEQLRMRVQVSAPGGDLGLQFGESVLHGHLVSPAV